MRGVKKKCVNPLPAVASNPSKSQRTSGPLSNGNQKDKVSEMTSPAQGSTIDTK